MTSPSCAIPEGRTARLILKPLGLEDAPQIQALFPQWDVVRYLNAVVPWPYPPDGAERFLREMAIPKMERGESWHWTLRPIEEQERIIGSIGLIAGEEDNRGFWLVPEWRGRGLMSEACAWACDFWFDVLGFERLRVPKAAANVASRRISERQGMHLVRVEERDYVSGRLRSEIWEITAEEWREWKTTASNH
ncbi:MAG TPA: GNAT family N-acetyltransferase [Terracidiphilus sp.]|nr:GNAT family N-acetyltransferase [Terracidiphilus sp.]